ncbi:CLUMA_CG016182, isoform A [Clunio marinus]|uniref:CLUMA_CG016182, isoform A n=1 Tax=Clunio marinus TaxID=568069 RepID=A0A1J1IU32_9DIPT|nr:CLUMA_CG016182, isoform A [Clunio marinus]
MESDDLFVNVNKHIDAADERLVQLRDFFFKEFSTKAEFFVKVPGRVNLIGEHVDYSGFPVCPMALSQNILLAVATSPNNDDIIHLKNMQSKYKSFKCSIDHIKIELPKPGTYPGWHNYFLCGVKGILDYIHKMGDYPRKGFLVAVSGNIPPAAGLSSSSALVCSAALTTAFLYDLPLNKTLLATLSASSEHYIGTQGGGMDQAIAFLAKKGCAQYIEFNPVRATPIQLPPDAVFVIANSLAEANKAATSDFNKRVVECRIATKLLAKFTDRPWQDIEKLGQLQSEVLDVELEEFEALIKKHLTKDVYTKDELMSIFHIHEKEFEEKMLTPNTKDEKEFKLKQRALHVIQEAIRVEHFRHVTDNADDDDEEDAIDQMSELMKRSHKSLRNLYECSHENLEELIKISKEFGVGARLTGAGWGGCIVALTDSITTCDRYIATLNECYYDLMPQAKHLEFDQICFATEPQNGAEIFIAEFS